MWNSSSPSESARLPAAAAAVLCALLAASPAIGQTPSKCLDPAGDLTGSGSAGASDVQCAIISVLTSVAGVSAPPGCLGGPLDKADLDCDGSVGISDVQLVIRHALGLSLPVSIDLDSDGCADACEAIVCAGGPADGCSAPTPGGFEVCVDGPGCTQVASGSTCSPTGTECGAGACVRKVPLGPFQCACPTGLAGAHCEVCAEGYHAVNRHGVPGTDEDHSGDGEVANLGAPMRCAPNAACAADTCGPHGTCVDVSGATECICPTGYAGEACGECAPGYEWLGAECALGPECRQALCGGRGECVDAEDGFECLCDEGLTGARCERCADGYHELVDGCAANFTCADIPCAATGTCVEEGGRAECVCQTGHGGPDCGSTCLGIDCGPGGTCTLDAALGARCVCGSPDLDPDADCAACAPGLIAVANAAGGLSCELPALCDEDTCSGHGTCSASSAGGPATCTCEPGFVGASCWRCDAGLYRHDDRCLPQLACDQVHCSGHGACAGPAQAPSCVCHPGYGGAACEATLPVASYVVSGAMESVEWGEQVSLHAEALGVGNLDALRWELVSGPGTLVPGEGGTATYLAPTAGDPVLDIVTLKVGPACCPDQGTEVGLSLKAPGLPGVTGKAKPAFKSVDQRIMQFMYDRCSGGAVVGINWMGVPVFGRGYGRNRGRSTEGRPAVDCGPAELGAMPVYPDSGVRLGSVSKPIAAGILRKQVWLRLVAAGRAPSLANFVNGGTVDYDGFLAAVDAAVEAVRILDGQLDLVPPLVRSTLGTCTWQGGWPGNYQCVDGAVAPPVTVVPNGAAPTTCNPNPCLNRGNCVVTGPNTAACNCPNGFNGLLCEQPNAASGVVMNNGLDRRYQDITVGHLLRHTAGFPRNGVGAAFMRQNLAAIREFHDGTALMAWNAGPALTSYVGAGWQGDPGARFLEERPSAYEFFLADMTRPLEFPPNPPVGVAQRRQYSNQGFATIQFMAEYMSGHADWKRGTAFAGDTMHHTDHLGSLVDAYVRSELGGKAGDTNPWGATRSRYGMFLTRTPDASGAAFDQLDPAELQPRHFDFGVGAYNVPIVDDKGIVCTPVQGGACALSVGAIDFFGNLGSVPFGYHRGLTQAGVAELIAEAPLYLRFARKYLVGSTATFAGYARRRLSWDTHSQHFGSWPGARATVQQIGWNESPMPPGGGPACTRKNASCDPAAGHVCCPAGRECVANGLPSVPLDSNAPMLNRCVTEVTYNIPIVDPVTGAYTTDPSPQGTGRCVLPRGLDFFIAVNQRSDAAGTPDANGNGTDYDFFYDAMIRGLCEVNWAPKPFAMGPQNTTLSP